MGLHSLTETELPCSLITSQPKHQSFTVILILFFFFLVTLSSTTINNMMKASILFFPEKWTHGHTYKIFLKEARTLDLEKRMIRFPHKQQTFAAVK